LPGAEALRQQQAPTGVRHRARLPPRRCARTARRSACWNSWWARPARRPTRRRRRSRRARPRRMRCWSRRAPSGQRPSAGRVRVRVILRARPRVRPPCAAACAPGPARGVGRARRGVCPQHARMAVRSKSTHRGRPASQVGNGWGAGRTPAGARGAGGQARHPRVLRRGGRPRGGGRAAPARERRAHPAVGRPVRCAGARASVPAAAPVASPKGLSHSYL